MKFRILPWISALALVISTITPTLAHDGEHHDGGKQEQGWPGSVKAQEAARALLADAQEAQDLAAQSATTCTDGVAGGYPCSNVDLLSFLPLGDIGGGKGNDIWGWTDPSNGREYAIMGRTSGTAFVDITDPGVPVYLGNLPTTRFSSTWRDIKVYKDHAFIVSEARNHGMQVFDLTRLRDATGAMTFSADANYTGFTTAHNIAINEDSGYAYAIGSNTCSGGLHIVDIRTPKSPVQAGCYSGDGYTHDVQCVNSILEAYAGRELCFASNEDTLTIVDVTDKSAPVQLARLPYDGAEYTHQGWLTDDQRHFLIDDELDEGMGINTRTYVFDVADPRAPLHVGTHEGTNLAIDHNQYIVGNHTFQANYRSGLRILDISGVATASLSEVAYFDVYPADDQPEFNGAWSVYPFFASGHVVVSGIEQGLFVLRPNLSGNSAPSVTLEQPVEGATVSGSVPLVIDATDAEDAAGALTVEWSVDGGGWQPATYDSATQRYEAPWDSTSVGDGGHTITARATDAAGASATDPNAVTVDNVATSPPTASFTSACVNLVCDFDASDSTDANGSITSYDWDFGDGSTGGGAIIQHSYSTGGTYEVVLTVTDNDGETDIASTTLKIDGPTATMHVGNLDGRAETKGKSGRWEVFVTVTVHDGFEQLVEGATVTGDWSGALTGTASGTTGSDGTVTISTGTLSAGDSVTLTVTGITHTTLSYAASDNHETTITITKS